MADQHYYRTKYIPFAPNAIPIVQANTATYHVPQPTTGQIVGGHVYQNVCIGGGMMTRRIPITPQSNHVFSSPVHMIQVHPVHTHQSSGGFVSPVNLIGSSSAPSKVVQTPTQTHWSSAGTIIVDDSYKRRNGKICQAIFLGLNGKTGMYELPYGKRNPTDACESHTALRETQEEMSNMFSLSFRVYDDNYRVSSLNGKHHAYVVRVKAPKGGIQSSVFSQNQMVLKSHRAPYEWTELSSVTRIDISDAISSGILTHTHGDITIQDVYGNYVKIFSRDAEFISAALRANMNARGQVHQLKFISSWDDARVNGQMMFLNGTSSYKA